MKTKSFDNKHLARAFAKGAKGFVEELDSKYIVFYKGRRTYNK